MTRRTACLWVAGLCLLMCGGMSLTAVRAAAQGLSRDLAVSPYEGLTVQSITVRGAQRLEPETVQTYLSTEVGRPLRAATVSDDIKNIWAQGFFLDVRVEVAYVPGGVALTYIIVEKPTIHDIRIQGNKKIKDDKIREELTLERFQILDVDEVEKNRRAVFLLYQSRGYYLTTVGVTIQEEDDNQVDVIFDVVERSKITVRDIAFLGNEVYSDRKLRKQMRGTRIEGPLALFNKSGTFDQTLFDADMAMLYGFYMDHGYVRLKLGEPQVYLTPDKQDLTIAIPVSEGPQYFVGEVHVRGELILPEDEILEKMNLQPDDVFSGSNLRADRELLTTLYGDQGYAHANIFGDTTIRDADRRVDVTFEIHKGRKAYIGRIDIVGNDKTRDKVIRRQLQILEGQMYNTTAIKKSEESIMRLGFFAGARILETPGKQDDHIDLTVVVEEQRTGSIGGGVGFSSTQNFIFNGNVTQDNVRGYGQRVSLNLLASSRSQQFQLSFFEPHLVDSRFSLSLSAFSNRQELESFTRAGTGATVGLGRYLPRSRWTRVFVTYRFEDIDISNFPDVDSIFNRIELASTTSSLTVSIVRNTTNNLLDPTKGTITRLAVEKAGAPVGGDNDFWKYTAAYTRFQPALGKTYFAFNAEVGLLDFDDGDRLLLSERYILGGLNDLRGFAFGSVGPRFPADDPQEGEIVFGGNKQVVGNVEYIIPIIPRMGIKFVVFLDAGNAYLENEPIDLTDVRSNWGAGIRWVSPLGPLRFELGFPFDRREGERATQFNFAVGSPFR